MGSQQRLNNLFCLPSYFSYVSIQGELYAYFPTQFLLDTPHSAGRTLPTETKIIDCELSIKALERNFRDIGGIQTQPQISIATG